MNHYLFELLRRIEEGARRLSATIIHNADKSLRDIALVDVEVTEIENALAEFKREVASGASVGHIGGRMIKN
jgi:hypothetical protein